MRQPSGAKKTLKVTATAVTSATKDINKQALQIIRNWHRFFQMIWRSQIGVNLFSSIHSIQVKTCIQTYRLEDKVQATPEIMPCFKQLGRRDYDITVGISIACALAWHSLLSLSVELFPSRNPAEFCSVHLSAILRKGYLSESVPIHMSGIGGPGAPHSFIFSRRASLSRLDWGDGQNLPLIITVWGSVLC